MSYYTQYSNEGVTPWSAFLDVIAHPIDSARAFIAAPIALISGASATVAEKVSGIDTPKLSDLPAASSIADVVRSDPSTATVSDPIPIWLKFTIAGCAVMGVAVTIYRLTK